MTYENTIEHLNILDAEKAEKAEAKKAAAKKAPAKKAK